jgi:hypothetical protein
MEAIILGSSFHGATRDIDALEGYSYDFDTVSDIDEVHR